MNLFDLFFGCWHKRCSAAITVRGKLRRSTAAASVNGTYLVCLDCGREFPYDWSQMKIRASNPLRGRQSPSSSFSVSRRLDFGLGGLGHSRRPNDLRSRSGKQSPVSGGNGSLAPQLGKIQGERR